MSDSYDLTKIFSVCGREVECLPEYDILKSIQKAFFLFFFFFFKYKKWYKVCVTLKTAFCYKSHIRFTRNFQLKAIREYSFRKQRF